MKTLVFLCIFGGAVLSVRARMQNGRWRSAPAASPLTKALTGLVGTAGGIYLSLELLLAFLEIPEELWNPPDFAYGKPLALASLAIAIIQPYFLKVWRKLQGGRRT